MSAEWPLKLVFGERTKALQQAVNHLFSAMQNGTEIRLPDDLLRKAQREYHKVTCANESKLETTVLDMFGEKITGNSKLDKIFITEGLCDVTGRTVRRRSVVGRDIRPEEYNTLIENADERLGRNYPPECFLCTEGEAPATHPTTLSFTRYMASTLTPAFDTVYTSRMQLWRIESQLDRIYAQSGRVPKGQRAKLEEERKKWESVLRHDLANREKHMRVTTYNGIIFVSTRIKGSLADKILRTGLDIDTATNYTQNAQQHLKNQILDLYGIKVITKSGRQQTEAEYARKFLVQRFKNTILQDVGSVNKPGHKSIRFRGKYDDLAIEFQFQSYKEFEEDRLDHRRYRLTQLQDEYNAKMRGLPVDALKAELHRLFNYLG